MPGRCRVTDMSIEAWHGRSGPVAPSPARRDAVSLRRGRLEAGNVGSHDYHPLHQTGTTPLPVLDRFSCASRKNSKNGHRRPFPHSFPSPSRHTTPALCQPSKTRQHIPRDGCDSVKPPFSYNTIMGLTCPAPARLSFPSL